MSFRPSVYAQFLGINDSSSYFHADSVIAPFHIPETSGSTEQNDENIILEIENSLRNYWKNEFMNMISTSKSDGLPKDVTNGEDYEKFSGKIIRNIDIKQLDIFGQTVSDTTKVPLSWIENFGNEVHVNTRHQILRKKLLIHEGDSLNPFIIADNERLLRALPYIKNDWVIISAAAKDSVDVLFITKDVYSIGFGLEISDISKGQTGIWNNNLFGIGHEFYYYLSWDYTKRYNYGHTVRYRIQNIGNTFITAVASYENIWELEAYKISLNRNFLTPEMKYAGGVGLEKIKSTANIELQDTILTGEKIDYDFIDLWLGRSFLITQSYRRQKRTSIGLSGRIMRYNFLNRPEDVSSDFFHDYHTRTMFLGSIGLSGQAYKKTQLVYGFGKSEDIPYGALLTFTGGYEIGEFFDRPYLGFSYSFGTFGSDFGMLYYKIEYGTFFNNGMEQGRIDLLFNHFSPLFNKPGRYNYRLFTKINYNAGINRFNDDFIKIENNSGIRGLKNENLKGNQSFNINFETVCYSPHIILGFRFLYFFFVDAGIIKSKNKILTDSPVYSGFGAGVRIRNENLVFNTIQLRFSYYPVVPSNSVFEFFNVSGISTTQPESFIIPKPAVMK